MLKLGIAGLGRWGRVLVDSVQGRSDKVRFVAGTTGTRAKAEDYARQQGIRLHDDLAGLLADGEVQAIVLATPHSQHAAQMAAVAATGRPVFVEKPLTLTHADALAATKACDKVVVALGHNRRFMPAYRELQSLVASGALGTVLHVSGNYSANAVPNWKEGMWRATRAESPAGGMTGLGIHLVDAMIGLGLRFAEVHVRSTRRVMPVDVDDTTTAMITFEGGAQGVLTTMVATSPIWRLDVYGSNGWATMDQERRLVHAALGQPVRTTEFPAFDAERAELEAFAAAVAGIAPFPITVPEMVHGIAAFEAIIGAAAEAGLGMRKVAG